MTTHRPGLASSRSAAVKPAPAGLLSFSFAPAGVLPLPHHAPGEFLFPIETAKLGTRGLRGELRPPHVFGPQRPANRLRLPGWKGAYRPLRYSGFFRSSGCTFSLFGLN